MQYKPGLKLHCDGCDAQFVVVRVPAGEVELTCGGAALLADGEDGGGGSHEDAAEGAALMGKRYTLEDTTLELLCTRSGKGVLAGNGSPLQIKGAKPLPASD